MPRQRFSFVLLAATLAACTGGAPTDRRIDSNTNWLTTCVTSADCSSGAACLCGACTAPCSDTAACDVLGQGTCAIEGEPAWEAQCAADPGPPAGLCLPSCDAQRPCATGSSCVDGICAPDEPPPVAQLCDETSDAGPSDAGDDDAREEIDATDEIDTTDEDVVEPPDAELDTPDELPDVVLDASESATCDLAEPLVCGLTIGGGPTQVYDCSSGDFVLSDLCPLMCVPQLDRNDACDSGAGCFEGPGFYCGQTMNLPPGILFYCNEDGIFNAARCAAGCEIVPDGPDRCLTP